MVDQAFVDVVRKAFSQSGMDLMGTLYHLRDQGYCLGQCVREKNREEVEESLQALRQGLPQALELFSSLTPDRKSVV